MNATVPSTITTNQNTPSMIRLRIVRQFIISALCLAGAVPAFAQGTVSPVARQTWLDNNGAPLANGRLCTFQAGTSTLANTYTTSALNVANANPLVLDSAGRGTVFLTPGSTYKFVLKDATTTTCVPDTGVTIWSVDNVSAVPASNVSVDVDGVAGESIAAGQVVYLSNGSGSKNAGQWYLADADLSYASLTPQIGIAPAAIASGATGSIRIQGRTTVLAGLTTGGTYFVSGTAGALTSTAPSNARYVGQADSTTALVTTPNPPTSAILSIVDPRIKTIVNGRLSLTTGVPVTVSDVTGASATTIYWVPYVGNEIALYSGTAWVTFAQAQLSIAVPATTSTMYDVFMDYNSGTPALSLTAWTNDTTRATALTTQDGIYVKTGATTSRYLGSFRTTAVSGQTEDSVTKRFLWNYYNRVPRMLLQSDTTSTWTYTTATWRQMRASTANQVEIVTGVAEVPLNLTLRAAAQNSAGSVNANIGIGQDSTTAPIDAKAVGWLGLQTANQPISGQASIELIPAVGYHYYAALEGSTASGTTTWIGAAGSSVASSDASGTGLKGWIQG